MLGVPAIADEKLGKRAGVGTGNMDVRRPVVAWKSMNTVFAVERHYAGHAAAQVLQSCRIPGIAAVAADRLAQAVAAADAVSAELPFVFQYVRNTTQDAILSIAAHVRTRSRPGIVIADGIVDVEVAGRAFASSNQDLSIGSRQADIGLPVEEAVGIRACAAVDQETAFQLKEALHPAAQIFSAFEAEVRSAGTARVQPQQTAGASSAAGIIEILHADVDHAIHRHETAWGSATCGSHAGKNEDARQERRYGNFFCHETPRDNKWTGNRNGCRPVACSNNEGREACYAANMSDLLHFCATATHHLPRS